MKDGDVYTKIEQGKKFVIFILNKEIFIESLLSTEALATTATFLQNLNR